METEKIIILDDGISTEEIASTGRCCTGAVAPVK